MASFKCFLPGTLCQWMRPKPPPAPFGSITAMRLLTFPRGPIQSRGRVRGKLQHLKPRIDQKYGDVKVIPRAKLKHHCLLQLVSESSNTFVCLSLIFSKQKMQVNLNHFLSVAFGLASVAMLTALVFFLFTSLCHFLYWGSFKLLTWCSDEETIKNCCWLSQQKAFLDSKLITVNKPWVFVFPAHWSRVSSSARVSVVVSQIKADNSFTEVKFDTHKWEREHLSLVSLVQNA